MEKKISNQESRKCKAMNRLDILYTEQGDEFARRYFQLLCQVLNEIDVTSVDRFIRAILDARGRGATIFFIGNGGSAATASHFANDLAIGTKADLMPIRALSLVDNVSILTALGNDLGYENIFLQQLRILGRPGDLLVGISASGNSPNLLNTFEYAKTKKIRTFALTAFDGGLLKKIADDGVHVPTEQAEYGPAEDAHIILDHLVGAYLLRRIATEKTNSGV